MIKSGAEVVGAFIYSEIQNLHMAAAYIKLNLNFGLAELQ
jgi:hypothetical protein